MISDVIDISKKLRAGGMALRGSPFMSSSIR